MHPSPLPCVGDTCLPVPKYFRFPCHLFSSAIRDTWAFCELLQKQAKLYEGETASEQIDAVDQRSCNF